jgi:hypothetical protein
MSDISHDRDNSGRNGHDKNIWKDEKYQWKHELDGRLGGHFFRPLAALSAQCVGEGGQGFGNRRSKTVRLHQHRHERPDTFDIGPIRESLPSVDSPSTSSLLEVNLQKLFTQFPVTHSQFLTHAHHSLVRPQTSFHADRQQVQSIREAQLDSVPPPVDGVREPKVRYKEPQDNGKDEKEEDVLAN